MAAESDICERKHGAAWKIKRTYLLMLARKQGNVKPGNYTNASKSSPCKRSIFLQEQYSPRPSASGTQQSTWGVAVAEQRPLPSSPSFCWEQRWVSSAGHGGWPPLKACQHYSSTSGEPVSVPSLPLLQPLWLCLSHDPGGHLILLLLSRKRCVQLSW